MIEGILISFVVMIIIFVVSKILADRSVEKFVSELEERYKRLYSIENEFSFNNKK